jgi:hypothetical protein
LTTPNRQQQRSTGLRHTLLGLVIVLIGLALVAVIGRAFWNLLTSAFPQIGAAIISASGIILVAVIGATISRRFEQKQQIEPEQRQRKAEVYTEFLEYWFWAMRDRSKVSDKEKGKRDLEYRRTVPHKLVVWGSEPFIKEYGAWFLFREEPGTMLEFEKLLHTIRADLGYKDRELEQGELLKLFRKGVDEYLSEQQKPSTHGN